MGIKRDRHPPSRQTHHNPPAPSTETTSRTSQIQTMGAGTSDAQHALDDPARLAALQQTMLLDSPPEEAFDRLTRLAAKILRAPTALVSLVDQDRQFFKSYAGLAEPWTSQQGTLLTHLFCRYVAITGQPLLVEDARKHPLVQGNLAIDDLGALAYAGVPLITQEGYALGAFCVIDNHPRAWTQEEIEILKDLSASVMTEIELRATTRQAAARASQLEATFEAIADAVLVYDKDGTILQANAAARELLASDQSDVYTLPLSERMRLFPSWDEQKQPFSDESWPARRILNGETLKGATSVESETRTSDGRQVMFNASGAPVRDSEGQIIGGILLLRDVTERRQIEQRTEATLNALLAMAQALVFDSPETELAANQTLSDTTRIARRLAELTASVLGCQRVSLSAIDPKTQIARPVAIVGLSPEQEQQWWAEQPAESRLEDSPMPELVARLLSGDVLTFDMRQPPFNAYPNPYGVTTMLIAPMHVGNQIVGVVTLDYGGAEHAFSPQEIALAGSVAKLEALVVERARLLHEREESRARELALRQANERMDAFLGIASHELKTPITSIKAGIQLAQRRLEMAPPPESRSLADLNTLLDALQTLLNRSDRQTRLLNRLVDDLLDVSRIQSGKLEFHLEQGDLVAIVRDAVQEQSQLAPKRTIRFQPPAHPNLSVFVDADRIGQVVTNYLTNALKYSKEAYPVEVGLEVEGQHARLWVRDQGPGLPSEEQARIWERFHRAEGIEIQSGSGVGLGLGLYISRTIIERHHGQVGVQSTPGQGSTFWFILPLAQARAARD